MAQFAVTRLLPLALLFALLAGLFLVLPVASRRPADRVAGGVAGVAILAVQLGTEVYFGLFGDANAVYGTMGLLLAVVFAAYLIALAVILGAHVSARRAGRRRSRTSPRTAGPHDRAACGACSWGAVRSYWRAIATRRSSSGLIRWSRSSAASSTSIWTQRTRPVKALS